MRSRLVSIDRQRRGRNLNLLLSTSSSHVDSRVQPTSLHVPNFESFERFRRSIRDPEILTLPTAPPTSHRVRRAQPQHQTHQNGPSSICSPGKTPQESSPATATRVASSKRLPAWPSTSGLTRKDASTPSTIWSRAYGKLFGYLAQPTKPRSHRCQSSSSAPALWHSSAAPRSNAEERSTAHRARSFSGQRDDHEGRSVMKQRVRGGVAVDSVGALSPRSSRGRYVA
jgi:hypothetical protein